MSVVDRALRAVRKLRGRSSTELRDRAAQAAAMHLERFGLLDARLPELRGATPLRTAESWREHLRVRAGRVGAPHFFAGLDDRAKTVAAIERIDRQHIASVVARAERIAAGKFDLLGYEALDFGSPVDWHLDPVAGVRAPMAHWSRIAYLDPAVAGDHKVVWELNRHQWLVTLGEAYWFTRDERWATLAASHIDAWLTANPPKRGINWASSLEVAFRAMAWCWVLEMFRESSVFSSTLVARMTASLVLHARHLERNLSTYFSPNTHLTGEALGLFHLGLVFPELRDAARWRDRAWRVLLEQLPLHARTDGVYFEQAAYYHRYTVDFYTHLLVLAERNGISHAREAIGPHLERLLEHLMFVARTDGTAPLVGDEDGGHLAWLDDRRADDVRSPLATGALLFNRSDFAFVAGVPTSELVWLLGADAPARYAALGLREPDGMSRAFVDGGVYVMRDGWGPTATHLVIDSGPHGMMNCGHAHADALSFELAVAGAPLLVEAGTYAYTSEPALRDWFRSTEAHNTLTIDGESSSVSDGAFHWSHIARSDVRAWHVRSVADWFEGEHDGYRRLESPATHRRGVLFVKSDEGPRYVVLRDVVESAGAHDVAITFQCASDVGVTSPTSGAPDVQLVRAGRPVLRLASFADRGAPLRYVNDDQWVSRRYGARQSAPRVRAMLATHGDATIVTLMLPADSGEIPAVERMETERGFALTITSGGFADLLLVGCQGDVDGVSTDAEVAWVRRRASDGAAVAALALGGSRLDLGADLALRSDTPSGAVAARLVSGSWHVDGDGARLAAPDHDASSISSLLTRP